MPYSVDMTTSTDTDQVPQFTVGDRLRKAREYAGLEQTELGEMMGVSRGTVSNYERGNTPPKRPVMLSWSLATRVPLEWLQTGEMPTPPDGGGAHVGEQSHPTVPYSDLRHLLVA